jgi:hypothetical protein
MSAAEDVRLSVSLDGGSRPTEDRRWLLVGAGAAVGPAGGPAPWRGAQVWLHRAASLVAAHETALMVAAAMCVVAAVALWAARARRGAKISAGRLRVVIVPTESFDPSMEAIVRFANMVAQARTPKPLLTPRRCQAVRIRLVSRDGDLAYVLETAQWRASAVRTALPAEAELHPVDVLEPASSVEPTPPRSPASPRVEIDDWVQAREDSAGTVAADTERHDTAEGDDLVVLS